MKFYRRLLLNNRECEELLEALESKNRTSTFDTARLFARHPFRISDVPVCVDQPEGGRSRFLMHGRNISRGGVSLLHGGYLHQDSECKLVLRTTDAQLLAVSGFVRHCRLVTGFSHEIGIQFQEEIELAHLIDGHCPEAGSTVAASTDSLGDVLVVEPYEPDRMLLEHQLRGMNVNPIVVASSGAAFDVLKQRSVDLVLSGLDLVREHGVYFVQMMRQARFDKPIIVMAQDCHPDTLAMVSQTGADDVLVKPFDAQLLSTQIEMHMGQGGEAGALVSHVQARPGMRPLVARFVGSLRRTVHQLRRAYANEDMATVRQICSQIKGSSLNYGFPALAVAALKASSAIDKQGDSPESRMAVRDFMACCERAKVPLLTGQATQRLTPAVQAPTLENSNAAAALT